MHLSFYILLQTADRGENFPITSPQVFVGPFFVPSLQYVPHHPIIVFSSAHYRLWFVYSTKVISKLCNAWMAWVSWKRTHVQTKNTKHSSMQKSSLNNCLKTWEVESESLIKYDKCFIFIRIKNCFRLFFQPSLKLGTRMLNMKLNVGKPKTCAPNALHACMQLLSCLYMYMLLVFDGFVASHQTIYNLQSRNYSLLTFKNSIGFDVKHCFWFQKNRMHF